MKKAIWIMASAFLVSVLSFAQTTQDPAVQAVREKLEVVYDLGRVFGYIHTMDKEQKKLSLTSTQVKSLLAIADKILKTVRFEPKDAESLLSEIEDRILRPDQLTYIDGLAIARAAEKTAPGSGAGSTGGVSPVQSYMNGGPFNPMLDTTKKIGQDFKAAYEYLKGKK